MVFDEQDEVIERIAGRLRAMPAVDAEAKARVLVAVAAERQRDREHAARRRPRVIAWAAVAGLAAAVMFTALMVERGHEAPGAIASSATATSDAPAQAPGTASAPAALAARGADENGLRPVQLVFRAPNAERVSVVGDFTGWDSNKAIMARDSGSGLWSVTLALPAGRHVYAFLVNDSIWVRDPRAPAAPDADFGRPGSVLLVGRP